MHVRKADRADRLLKEAFRDIRERRAYPRADDAIQTTLAEAEDHPWWTIRHKQTGSVLAHRRAPNPHRAIQLAVDEHNVGAHPSRRMKPGHYEAVPGRFAHLPDSRERRVDLGEGEDLSEAVDSLDHLEEVVGAYHYLPDPRDSLPDGKKWYRHDDGHSIFAYFDPTAGVRWHHYEEADKTIQRRERRKFDGFRQGSGLDTLDGFLRTFHTEATR